MEAALKKLIMAHPHFATCYNVDKTQYVELKVAGELLICFSEITNGTLGLFDMHQKDISSLRPSMGDEHATAHLFRLKNGTIPLLKNIVHDDVPFVIDTIQKSFTFLSKASTKEKKQFKLILDFCCNVSKGVRQRFILKLVTFTFDKKDKIWLILFSISPFSEKPLDEKPQRRMFNVTNGQCILFEKEQTMTKRPIEILRLIAEGMTAK